MITGKMVLLLQSSLTYVKKKKERKKKERTSEPQEWDATIEEEGASYATDRGR